MPPPPRRPAARPPRSTPAGSCSCRTAPPVTAWRRRAPGAESPRKPLELSSAQDHAVAAYVASLAGGPTIPTPEQVNSSSADLALGQSLFTADCAQCHNFDGAGGALTYGK